MTTFTIDQDNNITSYSETPPHFDGESFTSEKQLAKLTANWPAARLLQVWNSFAGFAPFQDLKPVKKFTDRSTAISRTWTAIQRLTPTAVPSLPSPLFRAQRSSSKGHRVMYLMRRPSGATLSEIVALTDWQAHSIRGFISGTISKKLGLSVESSRGDDGQRTYRILS